jgi:uncharacterized protein YbbC (DUF1343 family)
MLSPELVSGWKAAMTFEDAVVMFRLSKTSCPTPETAEAYEVRKEKCGLLNSVYLL